MIQSYLVEFFLCPWYRILIKSAPVDGLGGTELAIHWSLQEKIKLTALVLTGAECTAMHGHPQDFSVPLSAMDEYRGQMVSQESDSANYAFLHNNMMFLSLPIPENILGIDILQGHSLQISRYEFCLHVRITKVLSGITR